MSTIGSAEQNNDGFFHFEYKGNPFVISATIAQNLRSFGDISEGDLDWRFSDADSMSALGAEEYIAVMREARGVRLEELNILIRSLRDWMQNPDDELRRNLLRDAWNLWNDTILAGKKEKGAKGNSLVEKLHETLRELGIDHELLQALIEQRSELPVPDLSEGTLQNLLVAESFVRYSEPPEALAKYDQWRAALQDVMNPKHSPEGK